MNAPAQQPNCFGSHVWSATAPECVGGPDAGYEHPVTKGHTRERCGWYQACAEIRAKTPAPPQVIPPAQLIRPKPSPTVFTPTFQVPQPPQMQPPQPRPAPPASFVPRPPAPVQAQAVPNFQPFVPPVQAFVPAAQVPPQPAAPAVAAAGYAAPYVAQQGPQQVPVSVQQPGAAMPHYLTNPEPIDGGTGSALGRTLVRSAAKAIGHSVAAFFDHTPLKSHKPPAQ